MSPVASSPPPLIEQVRQQSEAVNKAFKLTGDAIRRILSTRRLLLSKKAQRRHLEDAVAEFEAVSKAFGAQLQAQNATVLRLARENDRLSGDLQRRTKAAQAERDEAIESDVNRPLFFTHLREAWSVLTGRHA